MQKKLIALALASLAGSAFAQSNVTIYGVADATFEVAKTSGAANGGANRGSFTRINSNSSLLGFKGSEALGNGLTAVFQMETNINLDGGGLIGSQRDTFVGLAGGFGTVVLGNLTGPTRGLASRMDLNAGATGPGANSSIVGKPTGGAGAGIFDTRFTNAAAYISPSFSGFSGVVGYTTGENKTNDQTPEAAKANTRGYDLGLNYTNGPIDIGLAYGDLMVGTSDSAAVGVINNWKNTRLAGSYTFTGGHKIVALYDHASLNLAQSQTLKRNTWGIGGKFMVTPAGGLIAQYYDARKPTGDFFADNSKRGAKLWEIGYEHSLSKRTILKASYTELKNQDNSIYDFNVGAIGGIGGAGNLSSGAGADPKVLAVGIRHTF